MIKNLANSVVVLLFIFGFGIVPVHAYKIENLGNIQVYGDFVLSPGKFDVSLNPGEQVIKEVTIINRAGAKIDIDVGLEDFSSPKNGQENISLLGDQAGPYSLRDYLKPEIQRFSLKHGEKITLPITIAIPANSRPGGLYAAVTFSASPAAFEEDKPSQVKTISRLASLFFVRVNGEVAESGQLTDFTTPQKFYFFGPVPFDLNFKNDGSVYLKPEGKLTISNLFGKTIYEKSLPAYFVMPGATRHNQETWLGNSLTGGVYRATAVMQRSYDGIADQKTVYFAVFPPMILLTYLAILIAIIIFIFRKFKKRQP
jgi:hypothetical protein